MSIVIDQELAGRVTSFLKVLGRYKAVTGLEGCAKSTITLDVVIKDCKDGEYVIYTCQSYEQLKEKQAYLMDQYGWKEENCPIIGPTLSKDAKEDKKVREDYLTNKVHTEMIYPETRVILCVFGYVKKCNWINNEVFTTQSKYMIVDEFSFSNSIIPELDYLMLGCMSVSKHIKTKMGIPTNLLQYVRDQYSGRDVQIVQDNIANGKKSKYEMAYWMSCVPDMSFKIVLLTSERLSVRILKAMDFKVYEIESPKMSKFNIDIVSSEISAKVLGEIDKNNQWGIFNYPLIISDKYTEQGRTLENKTVEQEIINHTNVRGSNALRGKQMLVIITHIPASAIKLMHDTISYFESSQDITFRQVSKDYYMDRIRQAVGRTVGHRYISGGSASVLIAKTLYKEMKVYFNTPCNEFPYSCIEKARDNKIDNNILDHIIETQAQLIRDGKKSDDENAKKMLLKNRMRIAMDLFDACEGAEITVDEVKQTLLLAGTKMTATALANYYGLGVTNCYRKTDDGTWKTIRYIVGLRRVK